MKIIIRFILAACFVMLVACSSSSSPGPLEGTWQMTGIIPMTITFRKDESEAMGMIEKVSYKKEGKDVLVTYLNGFAQGTTIRYTVIDKNTVHNELGTLRRIR